MQDELGGAAQQRPDPVAQFGVAEPHQVGQLQRQPGAGHRPERPGRVGVPRADGRCVGPRVGVVVGDPAGRRVQLAGGGGARDGERLDEVEQRGGAFGEVGDPGRPVVHLGVDVQGVARTPRRAQFGVPQPLEGGGQAAGPRAREQQVPAVVEQQHRQTGVVGEHVALDGRRHPAPRGDGPAVVVRLPAAGPGHLARAAPDPQRDAVVPRRVIRAVAGAQLRDAPAECRGGRLRRRVQCLVRTGRPRDPVEGRGRRDDEVHPGRRPHDRRARAGGGGEGPVVADPRVDGARRASPGASDQTTGWSGSCGGGTSDGIRKRSSVESSADSRRRKPSGVVSSTPTSRGASASTDTTSTASGAETNTRRRTPTPPTRKCVSTSACRRSSTRRYGSSVLPWDGASALSWDGPSALPSCRDAAPPDGAARVRTTSAKGR